MAMKSMIKTKMDPACPRSSEATAGGTKPDPASSAVMGSIRAVEVNPSEVAKEKGMANQQILKSKQQNDIVSDSCFPKIDSRAFKLTLQGGNHGRHWRGGQQ
jgi:hypothetical protein